MEEVGEVNDGECFVGEDEPEAFGDFGVVEVKNEGELVLVLFLFRSELADVLHLLVVELDYLSLLVEAEYHLQVLRKIDSLDPVVMQQVVLLLALNQPHLKFSILGLLLHRHQFSQDVLEQLRVPDRLVSLLCDLVEHVLEAHCVERGLLKGELHDFEHDYNEFCDVGFMVG